MSRDCAVRIPYTCLLATALPARDLDVEWSADTSADRPGESGREQWLQGFLPFVGLAITAILPKHVAWGASSDAGIGQFRSSVARV
jgi:hypothetical protein